MPRSKMVKPTKKQILDVLKSLFMAAEVPAIGEELNTEVTSILKAYKLV